MAKKKWKKKSQSEIYQDIANVITKKLEEGTVPWDKPWNPSEEMPVNFVTKKPYKGGNILLLAYAGFKSRYWIGFAQLKKLGGSVKGQSATPIVYFNFIKKEDDDGEEYVIPMVKTRMVFNLDQVEGIETPPNEDVVLDTFNDIEDAEQVVKCMPNKPLISEIAQDRAFYSPSIDQVCVPERKQFKSEEDFYATLFHELAHSTGHETRLGRFKEDGMGDARFGSHRYSKEELVAEFCSSFVCGVLNIGTGQTVERNAAYIKSWLRVLKENPKYVQYGISKAMRASNYILNIKEELEEE